MQKNIFMKKFVIELVIILLLICAVQSVNADWWPMFGHDLGNSRYSSSSAPINNYTKWIFTTGDRVESSPTVVDGRVYISSYDNKVYCLNALTGVELWSNTTGWDVGSSCAVADGKVYVGSLDSKIYCFNADTGEKIWENLTGGYVHSSPAIYNNYVYIGSSDNKTYCLDALTGFELWSNNTGGAVDSSPAVVNDKVYVGSNDTNVYCFYANNGTLNWSYSNGGSIISSPTVVDGKVYIGSKSGEIFCLDADNGTWIWDEPTGGVINSSPAVADGRVYIGSDDGKLYCFDADTGNPLWDYPTGGSINWSSPAVADGKVYISSSDGNLYCFNASSGNHIWNYTTGDLGWSSPTVADGYVYVGSWNGNVYCFGNLPVVFGTPSPTNGSIDNSIDFAWSIPINDPEGDSFDWNIDCSNGQSNSNNSDSNGTKSLSLSGLMYSTTYDIWVNATDSTGSEKYTMATYTFTTLTNHSPVFGTPSPANGSTDQPFSLSWSISINDPEGDIFNWTIECSNGQSANASGASNGSKSLSLSSLTNLTTYTVWVNATDANGSGLYTQEWYEFTTIVSQKPVFGTPSPANGSTNQPLSLTWSISISDLEDEVFNWTIECSNGQNNSENNATNGTKTLSLSSLSYYTNYYVWVNATDNYNITTSEWFWFKTKQRSSGGGGGGTGSTPNNPPVADSNGPYNGIINTPITFDGSGSTDVGGIIVSYDWTFGDGTTGEGVSTTHSYRTVGNYTVKLTVTDNGGLKDSDLSYVVISDKPNSPPNKPSINGNVIGKKSTNYNYIVVSTDEDDDAIKYVIDWDDGTDTLVTDFMQSATAYTATHSWASPGLYVIKVSALDEHNSSSENSELMVLIDAIFSDNIGYLIDTNSDGIYELFHSNTTGNETQIITKNGGYLIDTDGDGKWNYSFNPESGLSVYQEEKKEEESPGFELVLLLCVVALFLLLKRRKSRVCSVN